jgi:hypothetical protein
MTETTLWWKSVMRRLRLVLTLVLIALSLGGFFALRGIGILATPPAVRAQPVPHGDQEIAWIHAATSGSSWERFVAGIQSVRKERPGLLIEDTHAYPDQTAGVPEIGLGVENCPHRLWIRWYKLTSEASIPQWVQELARRDPAPLAVIGGDSSDRARDFAQALNAQQQWRGARPLLLLETATADQLFVGGEQNVTMPLMALYPERTFRFCFTNGQMAEAVRDLVWNHPFLRPAGGPVPGLTGIATGLGGDPWSGLVQMAAGVELPPPDVRVMEWRDDPYSIDLSTQFRKVLHDHDDDVNSVSSYRMAYSVGDYYLPNRSEAEEIRRMVDRLAVVGDQRQLLVLPASDRQARRMIRGLSNAAPLEMRNLLAVTGDSISFNVIYRDRDIAWHIQDMPVPLVLFAHQNPAAWPDNPEPDARTHYPNATDDELLNAEIVRELVVACFGKTDNGETTLLTSADALKRRLFERHPRLFEADGNRVGGRGEHVVCLLPVTENGRVLPRARIEIWSRRSRKLRQWQLVKELPIEYPADGGGGHGAF